MRFIHFSIYLVLALFLLVPLAYSIDLQNEQRLAFEHLLYISGISTEPSDVSPGSQAVLSFNVQNTGSQFVKDIRISFSNIW